MKSAGYPILIVCALFVVWAGSPVVAADHAAVYEVTFEATWSSTTHPDVFPPNAHFSWLIGGTHDDQVAFWTVGDTASLGIKRMAEWGSTTPLDQEVLAAVAAGHAGEVIQSADYPNSPGSVSTTFSVTQATPLVTIVTMIAPSPDWFTGVMGLDLRDGQDWIETLSVDVYPFDAGTDSGMNYTSSDQPTVPQEPVAAIAGAPFTPGVPVGTLVFTLQTSATDVPDVAATSLRVYPNPFNPRATVSFETRTPGRTVVTVHDLRGRMVRRLWEGQVAGPMRTVWDGRDDHGRDAPSATYLIRLEHGGEAATTRAVLDR